MPVEPLRWTRCNKTMVFSHGDLLFVFNWHPTASIPDYATSGAPRGYYPLLPRRRSPAGGEGRRRGGAPGSFLVGRRGGGYGRWQPRIASTTPRARRRSTCEKSSYATTIFSFLFPKQIYHISLKEVERKDSTNAGGSKPRTCGGDRSFFPFSWSFVSPSTERWRPKS